MYLQEINIGDWRFYKEIANIKSAILFQSEHAQWHMAQNRQYKIHQIPQPINHLVQYNKVACIVIHSFHSTSDDFLPHTPTVGSLASMRPVASNPTSGPMSLLIYNIIYNTNTYTCTCIILLIIVGEKYPNYSFKIFSKLL